MRNIVVLLMFIVSFGEYAKAGCMDSVANTLRQTVDSCNSRPKNCGPGNEYGLANSWATFSTFTRRNSAGYLEVGFEGRCNLQQCTTGIITWGGFGTVESCNPYELVQVPTQVSNTQQRPNLTCGSIVQVENQVLGESIPIVGASFKMNYFTSWVEGRTGDYKIKVPLAGASLNSSIASFDMEVKHPGGAVLDTVSFPNNQTNLNYEYVWDGLDSSGNPTIGSYILSVKTTLNYTGNAFPVDVPTPVGNFRAKVLGLGGWVPSVYNFYDKNKKVLFRGDGSLRKVEAKVLLSGGFSLPEEDGSVVYYFDSTGRQTEIKNGLVGTTIYTFSYDSQGYLSAINEPFSRVTTFNRVSGDFASITAPKGQVTSIVLDSNGYVSSFTNPNNESYILTYYGIKGLLHTFKKPGLQESTFAYDADGNLTQDAHSGGYFFNIVKNANLSGQNMNFSSISRMGRTTTYTGNYTENNSSTNITAPGGRLRSTSYYESSGVITSSTNYNGVSIGTTRNNDARFGSLAKFQTGGSYYSGSIGYSFSNTQNVTLSDVTNPFSITAMTLKSTKGAYVITTNYNPTTKTFSSSTNLGRTGESVIDSYQRPTSLKRGNLDPLTITYVDEKPTQIAHGAREVNFAYSSTTGYLESMTNSLSQTVGFVYDSAGRVYSKILPDLRTVVYAYDANGNITGITPPNRPLHLFGYNSSELPSSYSPPSLVGVPNVDTTYTYNNDLQLTGLSRPNGSAATFSYNSTSGFLTGFTTPAGNSTVTISSSNGLPIAINSPSGFALSINYTGKQPNMVQTNGPGGYFSRYSTNFYGTGKVSSTSVMTYLGTSSIDYTYDSDEMLTKAGVLDVVFDTPNGLLASTSIGTSPNKVTDAYTYNTLGEVTSYEAKYGTTTLYQLSLGRDSSGRVINKTQTMNATTNAFDYVFDSSGRLTQTDKNSVTVATYGYDDNSNRNSGTIAGQPTTATYDNQDRMTAYNVLSFTYNANGELTSKTNTLLSTTTNYTYDIFGNLISVTLPSSAIVSYEVDGLNRRVGRKLNGTLQKRWVYMDQTRIAAELDASGNIVKRFIYASKSNIPDYMIMGGVNYRIISDHLGSPRLVVKVSDGTVTGMMDHDEYGRVAVDTNPGLLPFGFAGGLYDADTGLNRFGARDYDAETGRWTAKDPILFGGGDTNLYGYTWNDPVNFIDPSGLKTTVIITRDYGFGSHAAVHITNGGDPVLYDPSGSYLTGPTGRRGSGDTFGGADASLGSFVKYQQGLGSTVDLIELNTSPSQEADIVSNIFARGGGGFLGCASGVSSVLGGCGITPTIFPGALGDQVSGKGGKCGK